MALPSSAQKPSAALHSSENHADEARQASAPTHRPDPPNHASLHPHLALWRRPGIRGTKLLVHPLNELCLFQFLCFLFFTASCCRWTEASVIARRTPWVAGGFWTINLSGQLFGRLMSSARRSYPEIPHTAEQKTGCLRDLKPSSPYHWHEAPSQGHGPGKFLLPILEGPAQRPPLP
ncbi:uncharacterized protein AAES06_011622 isoform 1-T3 [Glossophaga mutica]